MSTWQHATWEELSRREAARVERRRKMTVAIIARDWGLLVELATAERDRKP